MNTSTVLEKTTLGFGILVAVGFTIWFAYQYFGAVFPYIQDAGFFASVLFLAFATLIFVIALGLVFYAAAWPLGFIAVMVGLFAETIAKLVNRYNTRP